MATTLLTGWGHTAPTAADVVRPASEEAVVACLAGPGPRGVVARGLGRSYGDAAQNAGGTVLDTTALDAIIEADFQTGVVRVGGGLSLDALMQVAVPRGWFVPVTPGTRHITVGGAIAADIHGKNHHVDGSFASHVSSLTLGTPIGVRVVTQATTPELFWATAGGMGLTGIITDATVQLIPVQSAFVRVNTTRCPDLDTVMSSMEAGDSRYRYSVAWIDCLARGRALGRSILSRGDHAHVDELPADARSDPLEFAPRVHIEAPKIVPSGLVNRLTARLLNEAWFRKEPVWATDRIETISRFFHPLDGIGEWNRMYGRRGFVQYQFVVPFTGREVVRTAIERLSAARIPSSLAVLKRFGPGDAGPLSFPIEGWTLAMDMPVGQDALGSVLDDIDELVAAEGGRVYLAKDGRLRPTLVADMYPRLGEWRAVRSSVDPEGVLTSDLARRLDLI